MKDFILPDIGEGIVECELVEWLVQEGDRIEEDQPVADVMTDKALVQIPAPYAGKVVKLYYRQGDTVPVHQPLFAVETEGAASSAEAKDRPDEPADATLDSKGEAAGENFILPDIGEGIVECEVVEWLVSEGDHIEEDQPVVDVMTDKALVQIPAPMSGTVSKIYCQQGDQARVHEPLFAVVPDDAGNKPAQAVKPTIKAAQPDGQPASRAAEDSAGDATDQVAASSRRALATPAVRRICREQQLDIAEIPGSGKDGRVLKEDVIRFQRGQQAEPHATVAGAEAKERDAGLRVEPIRGVRAVMARQMALSARTIPHFTYADEVDVSELLKVKQQLESKAQQQGVRLTLMPFLMKALAIALQKYPILNSRVNDDCSEIHYLPHCNIGMAVDSKAGLMLPNIKRVERLSILEIAAEVQRLTEAARAGRIAPEDLSDGTISISNIGSLGGTYAVPVINPPEVAIVALGRIQRLPRFDADDQVVPRHILAISWSADHRVVDGATMARCSGLWQSYLQDPASLLLDIH